MPPIIEWERASLVLASGRPAFLLAFGFGFLFILRGRKSAKDVEAALPWKLELCSGTYAFKTTKFNS